eukprot:3686678-Rhodomonas_salina.1
MNEERDALVQVPLPALSAPAYTCQPRVLQCACCTAPPWLQVRARRSASRLTGAVWRDAVVHRLRQDAGLSHPPPRQPRNSALPAPSPHTRPSVAWLLPCSTSPLLRQRLVQPSISCPVLLWRFRVEISRRVCACSTCSSSHALPPLDRPCSSLLPPSLSLRLLPLARSSSWRAVPSHTPVLAPLTADERRGGVAGAEEEERGVWRGEEGAAAGGGAGSGGGADA